MAETAGRSGGLLDSLRRFGSTALEIIHTRIELFASSGGIEQLVECLRVVENRCRRRARQPLGEGEIGHGCIVARGVLLALNLTEC